MMADVHQEEEEVEEVPRAHGREAAAAVTSSTGDSLTGTAAPGPSTACAEGAEEDFSSQLRLRRKHHQQRPDDREKIHSRPWVSRSRMRPPELLLRLGARRRERISWSA